jgi:hypothetical protein
LETGLKVLEVQAQNPVLLDPADLLGVFLAHPEQESSVQASLAAFVASALYPALSI